MKKELLSHWINEQLRLHTAVDLARALGVSSQGLFKWRNQEVKRLSEKSLQSLADYKEESLEETCEWLGIPMPSTYVLVARIEKLEQEVKELKLLAA
ncbi:hypothetical protein D0962_18885 [Leptolyngbyaceae cyanobacterium CCMR0082]|uniref:HTH cro/C1-type domain-containing protein n=1 Tax=Adonisia turfae CCMR0082 TaxID=2304604 RepID=A0A6M0S8M9_9CYAN|nr:hypothetical protein [Adonisia turfae]NEZ64827.1 hypothetical protein [Adonisia turfae CCMR0082]